MRIDTTFGCFFFFFFAFHSCHMVPFNFSHIKSVPDPRGGKRGTCPPEATTRHTLAPEKKVNFLSYDPKIVMKKDWSQCELLILIQYQRDYRV